MPRKDPTLAQEAQQAYEKWHTYFKHNNDKYHRMHDFVLGDQWNDDERTTFINNKKVPLTANKLATLANYLIGEMQQNTPQIEVVPMANATQEVAQVRELIVKDISFSNDSQMVYQIAAGQAFIGGYGAYLIETKYTHPTSWDQDIKLDWFKDCTKCYWDVGSETVGKTDGMMGGYERHISHDKFNQLYGKKILKEIVGSNQLKASNEEVEAATDPEADDDEFTWGDEDGIKILYHYKREFIKDTLYKLSNGDSVTEEELGEIKSFSAKQREMMMLPDMNAMMSPQGASPMPSPDSPEEGMADEMQAPEGMDQPELDPALMDRKTLFDPKSGQPITIERKRSIKRSKIMLYQISGEWILDEINCSVKDIPVVFMDQHSYFNKKGQQVCRSFFDDCVDTQKYINYLRTQSAYILKVSRWDQYIGSRANVQGADTQQKWRDPQSVQGLLAYDESPSGAKPERVEPPELSMSLLSQYELAIQDLYTSTGIYPTQMGQDGREISGTAIDSRSRQGSIITQVPLKSVDRAITLGAQIINEMIPEVYDVERVIKLMSPEEGLKTVTVNEEVGEYGMVKNDIRKGTFQVRLKAGPSYQGQKQEALTSLKEVIQADPRAFTLVADLFADNLPLSNNIEIKNRLRTLVPPEVIEAGKTGRPMPPKPPQPSPEQQALMMEEKYKMGQIEIKKQELMMKMQQQEQENQLELMKLENERLKVAGSLQAAEFKYAAEDKRTESDAQIAHANNMMKILTHKQPELHSASR